MKTPRSLARGIIPALLAALLPLVDCDGATEEGFQSLFNGRDLSGWAGLPGFWSVRDGAITGQTTPERLIKANTFLVWKGGEPANFELRLSFRLTAQNGENRANSGIQLRSRYLNRETFSVGGYQADIDSSGRYTGMFYEERGRGVIMTPGERIRLTPSPENSTAKKKSLVQKRSPLRPAAEILAIYRIGDWNDLTVIARGNHVQIFLNGVQTADAIDDDPGLAAKSGLIAIQLHQGPPMTIQIRNPRLKILP